MNRKTFWGDELLRLSMVVLSLLGVVATVPALAQPVEGQGKQSRQLEEVTVTARRRSESLQDVPTMVSAMTAEDLDKYGINSVEDLELTTPGLIYADAVGYAMPYIRGIGSNSFSPSVDPTVGTFLDGFYSPSTVGSLQYIGDVESIQVLKGPQGTLFGRNTTAGAIVINTKKPSDELEGSLEYGMGTRNKEYVTGYLSGPLFSDILGFSVSGYTDTVDSHYTSTFQGADFEFAPEERQGFRVKLAVDPTDWMSLVLSYSESDAEGSKGIIAGLEETGAINSATAAATAPDAPRTTHQNVNGFTSADSKAITAKLSLGFDSVEAWLLAGKTEVVGGTLGDLDLSENDVLRYSYNKDRNEYFSDIESIEFQMNSVDDWSLFGISYNWLIGGYMGEASAGWDPLVFDVGGDLAANLLPVSLLAPIITPGMAVTGVSLAMTGLVDTDAEALFANISIDLLDSLTLDLGVRQSSESRKIVRARVDASVFTNVALIDLSFLPLLDGTSVAIRDVSGPTLDFDDTSFLAGLNYSPFEDSMFYLKFVQGFKSGTWNVTAILNEPDAIDPEEVDSYEIGFKGEFFDRSLRLNMAAFHYDYSGLQNYQVEVSGGGSVLVKSIDEAEVNGAEFDMTYAAPIEGLQFILSGSYLETEVTKWPDGPCYAEGTYLNYSCDLAGKELGGAPGVSASFDVNYRFFLFDDEFQVGANYYHNGGYFFDVQNQVEQGEYKVVGVRASWHRDEWGTTLSVAGKNITAEDYRDFGMMFEAGELSRFAPAAEWTASLKWTF